MAVDNNHHNRNMQAQHTNQYVTLQGIHYSIRKCHYYQFATYRPTDAISITADCCAKARQGRGPSAILCGEAEDPWQWQVQRPEARRLTFRSIGVRSFTYLLILTLVLFRRLSVSNQPAKQTEHGELEPPGREPGLHRVHGCDYWRWHFWFVYSCWRGATG